MAGITEAQVVEVIKTIHDPEIPVNIFDLGLIYEVDVQGNDVSVVMSLTSPSCPAAQDLPDAIETRVCLSLDADRCDVHVVWDPPWSPERITPEGRKSLGMDEPGGGDPEAEETA